MPAKLPEAERKARQKRRSAAWRAAHAEQARVSRAAYYAAHGAQERAYQAGYYAAHAEQARAWSAARRADKPEQVRASMAAWRAANPEQVRAHHAALTQRRRLVRAAKARGCLVCVVWLELSGWPLGCPRCGTDQHPRYARLESEEALWVRELERHAGSAAGGGAGAAARWEARAAANQSQCRELRV